MKHTLTVALCGTPKTGLNEAGALINDWFEQTGAANARLDVFSDPDTFKEHLSSGGRADIFIIGIAAHGTGSIDTVRYVRGLFPDAPVIVLSSTKNAALEAYELHVLRYLTDPNDSAELYSALDLAYLIHRAMPADTVSVRMTGETRNVNADDIVFVENNVRSMRYVLRDGSSLTGTRRNISFEEFFAPLLATGRFVQSHKSFIINIRYIRSVKNTSVVMTNGVQIPISRRHIEEVQNAYSKYGA